MPISRLMMWEARTRTGAPDRLRISYLTHPALCATELRTEENASVLLATLLLASDGLTVMPLAIVAVDLPAGVLADSVPVEDLAEVGPLDSAVDVEARAAPGGAGNRAERLGAQPD